MAWTVDVNYHSVIITITLQPCRVSSFHVADQIRAASLDEWPTIKQKQSTAMEPGVLVNLRARRSSGITKIAL